MMIIDKNKDTHCQLCVGEEDGVFLLWDNSTEEWETADVDSNPKYPHLSELIPLMFRDAKDWIQEDFRAYHTGAIITPLEEQSDAQKNHFIFLEKSVNFCTKHWISDGGEDNNEERKK